ncbi:twitching motility protein [Lasius niger]|uniref:Twitching motility protein n=1 Tax=Lasius niger TaxID=67767 RepID=A0A0J7KD45_LASNI|nr:twitching motility protein [Lasius niger]
MSKEIETKIVVSAELRKLLIEQSTAIATLKRVLINFKKLPKTNQTLPKITGRLTNLEDQWKTCQALHVRILQTVTAEEEKTIPYLVEEEFFTAEDAYLEAADYIRDEIG